MAALSTGLPVMPCESSSIASLYNEHCIPGFDRICTLLSHPDGNPTLQSSLPLLLEQRGRLRAWAGNSGVHRTGTTNLSLDHRLREASHIRLSLIGLLLSLDNALRGSKNPSGWYFRMNLNTVSRTMNINTCNLQ